MRRPQPDTSGGDAADRPGVHTKRRLPRLRSRKARFGALGALAVGVTGGLLAASALATPTPPPPTTALRVLLIGSGASDPTTLAWETALTSQGVPYQEVTAGTGGGAGLWTLPVPALTTGTTGNFNAVVFADDPADFPQATLAPIYAYEAQYHVRQMDGYVSGFPARPLGVTPVSTGVALDGTTDLMTAAGKAAFPGLTGTLVMDVGSFAYPATANAGFTSWISYVNGTQSLGGVYQHSAIDAQSNVQEAALFFNYNQFQSQWRVMAPGLIDWVTQNTHLGLFRNYATLHLDDMLNGDNTWNTTTQSTDFNTAARMSASDLVSAAQWSQARNFRLDWAFNAGESSATAASPTADPLLAQFQAIDPVTGKPYSADFGYVNHTWDHASFDSGCATQNYMDAEINQNAAFATTAGSGGLGGFGLTPDPNHTSNGFGTFDPHTFVPGEHSGLANLVPGPLGMVDPPSQTASSVGGSGGTLAAGSYTYAITDQYNTGGGESESSVGSSLAVAAGQTVTLNWPAVCKAVDYKIYREVTGSNAWSLIATVNQPNPASQDPTSTTNVSGGGMVATSYTDTGGAGTPIVGAPSSTQNSLEYAYQQNANLIPSLTDTGITVIGADASKPYPNPPETQLGINSTASYNGGIFAAGAAFADGPAEAVPRHPINIFYNAATQAEQVSEYNYIYESPPAGHCVPSSVTTCSATAATYTDIVNSVESGMFLTVVNNDPDPFYAHQTNLIGGQAGGVIYPVLNQLLTRYSTTFTATEPYAQPTFGQAADVLARKAAWAAAVQAGTVTATEMGGTITIKNNGAAIAVPISAPTGTLVEPAATPFGSAYAGSLSDWVTIPAGGTFQLQAPAAPYVTQQPTNVSAHSSDTVNFTATANQVLPPPAAPWDNPSPVTVQWYVSSNGGKTFTAIPAATSTTLTLTGVSGGMNADQYKAIFTNALGSAETTVATLGVDHTVPVVTAAPSAGALSYGTPLTAGDLSGGQVNLNSTPGSPVIPGTWSFAGSPDNGQVLHAGTHTEEVTFTPTDTGSYTPVTAIVQVTVNPVTPYVVAVSSPITYGQTVGSVRILERAFTRRGAAPLAGGSISVANPRLKPNAGRYTAIVTYIPADSLDYMPVTFSVPVTVNKAHPHLSAVVTTRKPAGGKAMSVLLTGLQQGAREQLVVQNSHGKTQTVLRFTARGSTQTVNIKLSGAHHRRLGKGNYRVVDVQGATSNTYAGSSFVRKFKIFK